MDVKSIVFWNRGPATGSSGDYTRDINAPFVFLNAYNDTLTGAGINGVAPDPATQARKRSASQYCLIVSWCDLLYLQPLVVMLQPSKLTFPFPVGFIFFCR